MGSILIIEDQFEIRENLEEILELAGYQVLTAANGKEGIQMAMDHLPSIIISDLAMPKADGYEVLETLKENPRTSGIPIIFLTASAQEEDIRKGKLSGADGYLTKPSRKEDLFRMLRKFIQVPG